MREKKNEKTRSSEGDKNGVKRVLERYSPFWEYYSQFWVFYSHVWVFYSHVWEYKQNLENSKFKKKK